MICDTAPRKHASSPLDYGFFLGAIRSAPVFYARASSE
jgi:hypothetical protein